MDAGSLITRLPLMYPLFICFAGIGSQRSAFCRSRCKAFWLFALLPLSYIPNPHSISTGILPHSRIRAQYSENEYNQTGIAVHIPLQCWMRLIRLLFGFVKSIQTVPLLEKKQSVNKPLLSTIAPFASTSISQNCSCSTPKSKSIRTESGILLSLCSFLTLIPDP